jgi:hypothetical protein
VGSVAERGTEVIAPAFGLFTILAAFLGTIAYGGVYAWFLIVLASGINGIIWAIKETHSK